MSERERFEAWALSENFNVDRCYDDAHGEYHRATTRWAWMAWQAARSGQAASGSQENARSDEQNGVGVGQPEAPTAAPLPKGWDVIRKDDLFKTIIVIAPNGYSAVTTAMSRNPENVLRMLVEDIAHPPARSGAGSDDRKDESWK